MLAIALGSPKKGAGGPGMPDDKGGPSDDGDSDERDSFDAFAYAAGIPEEKRDGAYEALRSMIETCAQKIKEGSYGGNED